MQRVHGQTVNGKHSGGGYFVSKKKKKRESIVATSAICFRVLELIFLGRAKCAAACLRLQTYVAPMCTLFRQYIARRRKSKTTIRKCGAGRWSWRNDSNSAVKSARRIRARLYYEPKNFKNPQNRELRWVVAPYFSRGWKKAHLWRRNLRHIYPERQKLNNRFWLFYTYI